MRRLFVVILGVMLFTSHAWAQEDYIGTATSALQDVLSNLKQSVAKLSVDNDQLAARDNAMKEQIAQLQTQLVCLVDQGGVLNKTASQLQDNNPRRAQQISHLEKENVDLDNHIQKTQDDIALIQHSLVVPSPDYQAGAHLQKEKLKLMKMIYDSQQRQELLHEAILRFQKNTPLPPAAGTLTPQPEGVSAAHPWDSSQLSQMELELKDLERNYSQLKDLMEQVTKKAKAERITVNQHIEEEKLQGSLNDFNHQGVALRADLDDLRSQMVDLDKRKDQLEMVIQHLNV